jgi:hypothetical protein
MTPLDIIKAHNAEDLGNVNDALRLIAESVKGTRSRSHDRMESHDTIPLKREVTHGKD